MSDYSSNIKHAASKLRQQLPAPVEFAVILGSGLGQVSEQLSAGQKHLLEVDYRDIACLPEATVIGHAGKLLITIIADRVVALCLGRAHFYEGYSPQQVCAMTYLLGELGVEQLLVTNAAGALNPAYQPGEVMLINDHINVTGQNPLIGQDEVFGTRFTDMSQAYSRHLNASVLRHFPECHHGIYAGVTGPSLETSAERRMLRIVGADAVGMSTVLEVIAAGHCGIEVMGLSAITNLAIGDENQQADTVEQVLHYAGLAGHKIAAIIDFILNEELPTLTT